MRELQLDRRISVPLLEARRERVQSVAVPVSLPCIAAGNEPFDEPGGMRSQRGMVNYIPHTPSPPGWEKPQGNKPRSDAAILLWLSGVVPAVVLR